MCFLEKRKIIVSQDYRRKDIFSSVNIQQANCCLLKFELRRFLIIRWIIILRFFHI